jgi:hypothetical protein
MILDLSRIEEIDRIYAEKDKWESECNELRNELESEREVQKRRAETAEREKQEALRLADRRIRELEEQLSRNK